MATEDWVVVTGASGGIGAATAQLLAASGYHLHLQYHQNEGAAKEVARACAVHGVQVLLHQADLTATRSIMELAHAVQLPRPMGLVYAAGIDQYGMLTDLTLARWEELLTIHMTAPLLLAQALLPWMNQERRGRIIMVSSIWGSEGAACEAAYSAVKSGMNGLVKALGKEQASSGVTVNAVAPGAIATQMMERFSAEEQAQIAADIPAQRLGKPEEVASLIRYLLSEESAYLTGQILHVNGGWLASS